MKNLILFIPFLFFVVANVFSQTKDTLISKEKLEQDFKLFRAMLEEAHPGIYRYTSKETFDKAFEDRCAQINHDMFRSEFYKLTVPLIGMLKCAHTKYMPDGVNENKYYFHTDSLFPLKLYFSNRRAYLIKTIDKNIQTPVPGTEVLSINHKPIAQIMDELWPYIFADGDGEALKYEELNQYFNGYYADFIETSPEYNVEFADTHASYKGIRLADFDKSLLQPVEPDQPYSIEFKSNTAILTISSFWKENPEIPFKKFLKNTFQEIQNRNCKSLIIDLRNNEGGMDGYGSMLYSYLIDKKFFYYKSLEMRTNKKYSFEKNVWMPKPRWLLRMLIKEKDGKYYWTMHKNLKIQKPGSTPFLGDVTILINGRSMSVTSEFCAIAYQNKRATFIGEETGGAFQGNNSGAFAILTLPNSKLTIGVPLVAYYMAVDKTINPSHGIIPQHNITPAVSDIIERKDPVMEYILNNINQETKK